MRTRFLPASSQSTALDDIVGRDEIARERRGGCGTAKGGRCAAAARTRTCAIARAGLTIVWRLPAEGRRARGQFPSLHVQPPHTAQREWQRFGAVGRRGEHPLSLNPPCERAHRVASTPATRHPRCAPPPPHATHCARALNCATCRAGWTDASLRRECAEPTRSAMLARGRRGPTRDPTVAVPFPPTLRARTTRGGSRLRRPTSPSVCRSLAVRCDPAMRSRGGGNATTSHVSGVHSRGWRGCMLARVGGSTPSSARPGVTCRVTHSCAARRLVSPLLLDLRRSWRAPRQ